MSSKRKSSSISNPAKKARKAIDLDTKLKVIKQFEGGKKVNVIARDLQLSHSTVSTILKDKERIREAVKSSAPMRSTVITKQRSGPIHEMEKLLNVWIESQLQKRVPLSLHILQVKALSIFKALKGVLEKNIIKNFQQVQVREYCLENTVPFKVLLLLDNAPGHPPHLADLHPNVKVVFLPPNTTPLIQPMDQGAIAAFKANYLKTTFSQAISATDADPDVSLRDFWKKYDVLKCIKNIAAAWEAVTKKCMNGVWKNCAKR
ncbi:tigger transposable element-derived protein 1-like [Macrobrachium rosenbergii]|uniref:tigger transposable element-derived protein 1-like n=1 Tax=Macrobrachium rosenbergii TaxID=79674 RepID=UPI0034D5CFE0